MIQEDPVLFRSSEEQAALRKGADLRPSGMHALGSYALSYALDFWEKTACHHSNQCANISL